MAVRTVHANTARTRERPGRTPAWLAGLLSGLPGVAIVLGCITLPVILGEIAGAIEHGVSDGYIEAVRPVGASTSGGVPAAKESGGLQLFDRHYYFVNGCISAPSDCTGGHAGQWGEYYAELRRLYEEAAALALSDEVLPFDEWAPAHTHFIMSQMAPAGAAEIARSLQENHAAGDIHIVGTSAGGAAVFTYLSRAMRGEMLFDARIRSVLTVDSPLGHQQPFPLDDIVGGSVSGLQASSMKIDLQPDLGEWARAAGIRILTVDTREDVVSYDPVPGVTDDPVPVYPQSDLPRAPEYLACADLPCRLSHLTEFLDRGSVWHIYTGSHLAESAREFIDEEWR